jgi:hypothetical protein
VEGNQRSFSALAKGNELKPGRPIPAPAPIFPRYVEQDATGTA